VQFILKSRAFLLELIDYKLHQCLWHRVILSPSDAEPRSKTTPVLIASDFPVTRDQSQNHPSSVVKGTSSWECRSLTIHLPLSLEHRDYCSFAYSALASFRMGMSGSASFQSAKKSW
jgi:hypothetical protein